MIILLSILPTEPTASYTVTSINGLLSTLHRIIMATTNNPLGLDLDTMYEPTDTEENVFDLLAAYLP